MRKGPPFGDPVHSLPSDRIDVALAYAMLWEPNDRVPLPGAQSTRSTRDVVPRPYHVPGADIGVNGSSVSGYHERHIYLCADRGFDDRLAPNAYSDATSAAMSGAEGGKIPPPLLPLVVRLVGRLTAAQRRRYRP